MFKEIVDLVCAQWNILCEGHDGIRFDIILKTDVNKHRLQGRWKVYLEFGWKNEPGCVGMSKHINRGPNLLDGKVEVEEFGACLKLGVVVGRQVTMRKW